MAAYTRRELSKLSGTGFDAIRYYEKFGLLAAPARGQNQYRQYDDDAFRRLLFIRQAKKCGFTLNEIKHTFSLLESPQGCNTSSDEVIDRKIEELDGRIAEMRKMKEMLLAAKEPLRQKCGSQIISFGTEGL